MTHEILKTSDGKMVCLTHGIFCPLFKWELKQRLKEELLKK